ncbi:MAG: DNA-binding response regulator [Bacteroidetes bacterium]|nr:DNA-binding response regulator [Rhodothermaceae bacterium RA]RMH68268.1 MAG: DNA-binding response regulator [Bacteroidota bacterium]
MRDQARLLLIEDEPRVAAFLQAGLEEEGYRVTWAAEGQPGLRRALEERFDLVILDIRLPDLDGVEVCRRLRLHDPALPILMLTALDAVEDRVRGLRAGADDYLPKPFAFDELLARIDALLRRASIAAPPLPFIDGPLTLNPFDRTCTCHGRPLELTPKEFDLLAYFLARPRQVLSRDDIHRDVWGYHFDRGTNLIDVYVGYVRRKLQEAGCPGRLVTVRGVGYRYVPGASDPAEASHA